MKYVTPIQPIGTLGESVNLYVKRDDLLPFSFGGNKVRIAHEYFLDMRNQKKNCIIGYGNSRSNLCRVIANMAYDENVPCYIVSPKDDSGGRTETSNSRLVNLSCGQLRVCEKTAVSEAVEQVITECEKQHLIPYYINGDKYGKGNEAIPVCAYVKVYEEIRKQSQEMNIGFDYIILASGTGMTQAGLLAGIIKNDGKEKVIGISVARNNEAAYKACQNYLKVYLQKNNISCTSLTDYIHITDEFLCGGYSSFDKNIENTIIETYCRYGIALDPTYTGKAFWGMRTLINQKRITGNVLFIHTGGTPLFFDYLSNSAIRRKLMEDTVCGVTQCSSRDSLVQFLERVDVLLPIPLSERVDLNDYAQKVLENGVVLSVEKDNEIVSACMFYCNDIQTQQAYITLLATLPTQQGKHYGNALMRFTERICKDRGMREIHLDTEKCNTKAIRFYENMGYYIESQIGKIHMIKEL